MNDVRARHLVLPLSALLLALVACDDPKTDAAKPGASASAKPAVSAAAPVVSASASAAASAAPAPTAVKRDFKCEAGDKITFNMPALEAEVRRKVGKEADKGPITKADLAKVKSINLTQAQVDFLDPCVFPFLPNVKDIFLGQGDLDDLKPLEGLTQLLSLRAAINKVRDAKPLARMTKLDRLDLSRSQIEDLTPISTMSDLTELALDDTPVADLTPLAKCTKLERISIKNTRVANLQPLVGLRKLKSLAISGSPITDTNVLAPLRGSGLKIETK